MMARHRRRRRPPRSGAARAGTIGAERSEILAHKCHEAFKTLGPGGVAVAVVGSSTSRRSGGASENRSKKWSSSRGAACVLFVDSGGATSVAVARRSRSGALPAAPAEARDVAGLGVLPAVYEMRIVRQQRARIVGGGGGGGVAAVQAALEGARFGPIALLGRVVRERTADVLLLRQVFPSFRNAVSRSSSSSSVNPGGPRRARSVPFKRPTVRATQRDNELALEAVLGVGVREVPIWPRHQVAGSVSSNNTLRDIAEEPR